MIELINSFSVYLLVYMYSSNFRKNSLSCTRTKKNLFVEYYKIWSKKSLTSKSNIYFNLIFLTEKLILRFADMWTYEIFEISNIYLIQVTQYVICVCLYIQRKMLNKYLFVSSKVMSVQWTSI